MAYLYFFYSDIFLSFTSYVLVKLKGSSSISYLAIFGSFVNSEATLVNILNVLRDTRNYTKQIINTLTIILISVMQIKSLLLVLLAAPFFLGPRISRIPTYVAYSWGTASTNAFHLYNYYQEDALQSL